MENRHRRRLAAIHVILLLSLYYCKSFSIVEIPRSLFRSSCIAPIFRKTWPSCLSTSKAKSIHSEPDSDSIGTNITITVPQFFSGETEHSYPSVLHKIHVRSILSGSEAAHCLRLATEYASTTGSWDQPDRSRHATYATCDFAVEECNNLQEYLDDVVGLDARVWNHLSELYGIPHEDVSYIDFFCAHYQGKDCGNNTTSMDFLEAHRDGSLLSFTITLSDPSEFDGGGTFFDALRDVKSESPESDSVLLNGGIVRPIQAGDGIYHSGKLLHGGELVTSGKRTVLVGFMDVSPCWFRSGALSKACCDWGRMDVASYRWERQQKMTTKGNVRRNSWPLSYSKWLPRRSRDSFMRGTTPAFESVSRRADVDFQRRKKLEAEDMLLRSILLPVRDDSKMPIEWNGSFSFSDDISIL